MSDALMQDPTPITRGCVTPVALMQDLTPVVMRSVVCVNARPDPDHARDPDHVNARPDPGCATPVVRAVA